MHQWTKSALIQVMACRQVGAKPLPEPLLTCSQLDPEEQTWNSWKTWNSNCNFNIFIHENAFENVVCEMAAILSREEMR